MIRVSCFKMRKCVFRKKEGVCFKALAVLELFEYVGNSRGSTPSFYGGPVAESCRRRAAGNATCRDDHVALVLLSTMFQEEC